MGRPLVDDDVVTLTRRMCTWVIALLARCPRTSSDWQLLWLDVLGVLLALGAAIGQTVAATFTVRWDPLQRSREQIRLRSRGEPFAFLVEDAGLSARERRVVSWFYRWHDAPDIADWRACITRFDLATPPVHTLRLCSRTGTTAQRVVISIDIDAKTRTLSFLGEGNAHALDETRGKIPLGGLTPERLVKDAMAARAKSKR
jgi:hypothetical protein